MEYYGDAVVKDNYYAILDMNDANCSNHAPLLSKFKIDSKSESEENEEEISILTWNVFSKGGDENIGFQHKFKYT